MTKSQNLSSERSGSFAGTTLCKLKPSIQTTIPRLRDAQDFTPLWEEILTAWLETFGGKEKAIKSWLSNNNKYCSKLKQFIWWQMDQQCIKWKVRIPKSGPHYLKIWHWRQQFIISLITCSNPMTTVTPMKVDLGSTRVEVGWSIVWNGLDLWKVAPHAPMWLTICYHSPI